MRNRLKITTYSTMPPFDEKEILRYAGCKGNVEESTLARLQECLRECEHAFSYRVVSLPLSATEFYDLFGESQTARTHLDGCEEIVIFAATVGLEIDRLVNKYAAVSTAKALFFQAIGAERIETVCEKFCKEFGGRRFSAGYGDFPIEKQKEFFRLLDCSRKIGLTLNDSLLMSPTKSVTAAVGVRKDGKGSERNCSACLYKNCEFKKI